MTVQVGDTEAQGCWGGVQVTGQNDRTAVSDAWSPAIGGRGDTNEHKLGLGIETQSERGRGNFKLSDIFSIGLLGSY